MPALTRPTGSVGRVPHLGRRLALVCMASLVVSCRSSTATPDSASSYAGTYSLSLVESIPVPGVLTQQPGYKLEATDGYITILNGFTYSVRVNFRLTTGTVTTPQWNSSGTYTVDDPGGVPFLSFTDANNGHFVSGAGTAGVAFARYMPTSVVTSASGQPLLLYFNFYKK